MTTGTVAAARMAVHRGARCRAWMLLFAAVLAAGAAIAATAGELRGLAGPQDSPPPTTQGTAVAPPPGPTTRPAGAIDEELARRLLGGKTSEMDAGERLLEAMSRAARLLEERGDAGEATQEAQQAAMAAIDKLIEQAQSRRGLEQGRSTSERSGAQRPTGRRTGEPRENQQPRGTGDPAQGNQAGRGAPQQDDPKEESRRRAEKGEMSRGWGFLPPRARDELIQGFDEAFPPKYREQVIEYYRNLAERARGQ